MKTFILYILTGLLLSAAVMLPFAGGISSFLSFASNSDMLLFTALWALGFALAAFVFGLITKDYSWIDRIWSILPVCFAWYYALRSCGNLPVYITAALVTVWGVRLTFNFARKGGYNGAEDYRWVFLRTKIKNPVLWQLFSFSFICLFQSGLFVLFTYPVYYLSAVNAEGLPALFWILSALAFALVCLEFVSDQQQWNFYTARKAAAGAAEAAGIANAAGTSSLAEKNKNYLLKHSANIKNGFLSQGLFSVCRHPNYFCELGFWWVIWLSAFIFFWNPVDSGIFGPAVLTCIFIGSTVLTESISSSKYPEYKNYKKKVTSAIIPWFAKK